jgi:Tfp pilus assembly protein PilO
MNTIIASEHGSLLKNGRLGFIHIYLTTCLLFVAFACYLGYASIAENKMLKLKDLSLQEARLLHSELEHQYNRTVAELESLKLEHEKMQSNLKEQANRIQQLMHATKP